jgi:dihydrofolate reductase
MGKVRTALAMSLDGFIGGPNDGPEAPMGEGGERLLGWYFGGDTEYRLPGTEMVFKVAPQTAELLREIRTTTGALVTGRRTFEPHSWVGRQTPIGRTSLCCYPSDFTRVGVRRIAFHVR